MDRPDHAVTVTLDQRVLARVEAFAVRQEEANKRNRRQNASGYRPSRSESLANRISGHAGEAALCVYLGLEGVVRIADEWRNKPDVQGWDVFTTTYPGGRLIVRPKDGLLRAKVLVIDASPEFTIMGWYPCGEARRPEWWERWREGGGAWYVPTAFLRPVPRAPQPLVHSHAPANATQG